MDTQATVRLDTFENRHFRPGAGRFKRMLWYAVNSLFFNSGFHSYSIKVLLLKIFGAELGSGVIIKPRVNIKYPWNLIVGNHVWIGENVWIDNIDKVQIGNHVCISQGALLLCGNHHYGRSGFDLITGRILLEDGVWIGARSIVGPNVVCRSHSVLSMMSVASKDLQAYTIYKGNPAIAIKERTIETR